MDARWGEGSYGDMVVNKEELENDSEAARYRPIELITENGFSIVRAPDADSASAPAVCEYTFVVRDPNAYELEITVGFDPEVVNEVIVRSRGRLSRNSSYWICCAERHLATYLWENDDYPPEATLKVELLTPHDLDLARRWGTS